jgi:hypothetical protein
VSLAFSGVDAARPRPPSKIASTRVAAERIVEGSDRFYSNAHVDTLRYTHRRFGPLGQSCPLMIGQTVSHYCIRAKLGRAVWTWSAEPRTSVGSMWGWSGSCSNASSSR